MFEYKKEGWRKREGGRKDEKKEGGRKGENKEEYPTLDSSLASHVLFPHCPE